MMAMYVPGHSLVHRCPGSWKLLALFIVGTLLACRTLPVWALCMLTGLCLILYGISGLGLARFIRQVWDARWVIAFTVLAQIWFRPITTTALTTMRITVMVLLASLVTLTTQLSEIFAVVARLLMPFEGFGLNTYRVGVAVSLGISVIPIISASMRTVREASQARGIRSGPLLRIRTWAVPLMVVVLKQADELADSLDARGM
ncbi:energy-coupling factor transporter transmembrane component T family protein [Bifidobacterium sp.]|uniref:energy-coupling factor transporter transmembrane component T family protein n=1 Tax=Bifidobacterium sp. TaxID=41200 RepID=UPI0039E9501F